MTHTKSGVCYRYGTEEAVGRAIRESGIPRNELFVTTKLWNHQHDPKDVPKAIDQSLKDLKMDYVDLFLMHWPVAWKSGNELFPKENGKPAVVDIDFVDVCFYSPSTGYPSVLTTGTNTDIQSNGKAPRHR